MGNLRLLHFLAFGNRFEGPIIEELFESIEMTALRLDGNKFTGKLSDRIGDLGGLRDLRLGGNNLTGAVPMSLFRLDQLGTFQRIHKRTIVRPENLHSRYVIRLEVLVLSNNKFQGQLKDSFGALSGLQTIDMSTNEIKGSIPKSLFELPNLRLVYLSNNELTGPLPSNFGSAHELRDFYVDGNKLSGEIPPILDGQLPNLNEFLVRSFKPLCASFGKRHI